MRPLADLLAHPQGACGESEQRCPLLRVCPVCGFRFVTTGGRRQHQNRCAGTLDASVVNAQHDHTVAVHRSPRNRRGRTGG